MSDPPGLSVEEWPGAAEVVPLGELDAEVAQQDECLLVFDALGDRDLAHAVRDVDDALDQSLVRLAARHLPDELDVDLELGDWKLAQVGQRSVAGAEVIE